MKYSRAGRAMGVRDVSVYGGNINSGHDDIWWERGRLGSDLVEKMVGILDMEGRDLTKVRWA